MHARDYAMRDNRGIFNIMRERERAGFVIDHGWYSYSVYVHTTIIRRN